MKTNKSVLTILLFLICTATVSAQQITKKRGKVKLYYANGQLHEAGKVKNYHRNGTWKVYDEEGRLYQSVTYRMDTVNGPFVEFYSNGQVASRGEYKLNYKSGEWLGFDQSGQMISKENFKHGVPHGVQLYWYPGGRVRDSIVMEKGKYVYLQSWYQGGGVKKIETYENGVAEGRWLYYPESYTDTFPETSDQYHLGKKHGWHYMWRGAALLESYHYVDGLPDGTLTRFQLDGTPLLIQNYSKGFAHGLTTYYKDGMKLKEEYYSWNQLDSVQTEFDREERVAKKSWYTTGNLDSTRTYFTNSKVQMRRIYADTGNLSYYTEWDSTGILLMKGMMLGENRDGEWTTYYPNGKVRSTMNYSNGQLLGLYTKYYPNGKKMIQYTFLPVGTNTQPDVWNQQGKMLRMGTKEYNEIVEGNLPGDIFSTGETPRKIINHRKDELTSTVELKPADRPDICPVSDVPLRPQPDSEMVYTICEVMPMFPGGLDSMKNFIQKKLRYPENGKDVEGVVYVRFIVEKDGRIIYATVARGINGAPEFDAEALRVVHMFPFWSPGIINGNPVRCQMIVPIRFKLS